jgi:SAM-dependent methyltransferase
MPKPIARFDAESARDSWDRAADVYSDGQASGRDYYRYDFFGPAQLELCGDVRGLNVLDAGCGNGYFSRALANRGARVTGIDLSPRMIERAKQQEKAEPLGIEYRVLDAAALPAGFGPQSFDMVTSCMALLDMPNVDKVFRGVHALLRPGCRFVASITHPCTDTPHRVWELDEKGAKRWLCVDRYFERGSYEYEWKGWERDFATEGFRAPLEDWFGWILDAGFQVRAYREPRPTGEALRRHPDLEDAARVPYYVLFDLVRPG